MPSERLRVSNPPTDKPVALFDGECGFCRTWVQRWSTRWPDRIEYLPFQESRERFPEIPLPALEDALHLVEGDGIVSRGAEAALRTRALARGRRGSLLGIYYGLPGAKPLFELGYRLVARNRPLFSRLLGLGPKPPPAGTAPPEPSASTAQPASPAPTPASPAPAAAFPAPASYRPGFAISADVFLRVLAVIYFIAFASLWWQLPGLIGPNGILPAQPFLDAVKQQVGGDRWWLLPTLCWIFGGGKFLHLLCLGGVVLSVLAFLRRLQPVCFGLMWLFYLSLCAPGQIFLNFQWDALLLETGLLAILLAPWQWAGDGRRDPPAVARWLLWWLLFRLMFMSGLVKLTSGDATWWDLTALVHHYETQPLPTWIGWWMHQLPAWCQRACCFVMFAVELAVPFLILAPRRLRHAAALVLIGLQILIALTGNYTFFNLLTAALCLPLLDDGWWSRWTGSQPVPFRESASGRPPAGPLLGSLAAALVVASLIVTVPNLVPRREWPAWFTSLHRPFAASRTVNSYGLFRVMTTRRPELVIEGSADNREWKAYDFKWKPGDPKRRPGFVAPYQPRVDWQLWFAALAHPQRQLWMQNFCMHLLSGTPAVTRLLGDNPFPDKPPAYLRVVLYEYEFTTPAQRRKTGEWWRRTPVDYYFPAFSLRRP